MATLRIELPDEQLTQLGGSVDAAEKELLLAAAFHLCRQGEISVSKAANLAGVTYAQFLDEAVRRNVDLFEYDVNDVEQELTRPLSEGVDLDSIKEGLARGQRGSG